MSLLEAVGVKKSFGGVHALAGCSLEVEKGKIGGIIGPNGSGKTTLFNVMTGYETVDEGEVRFDGVPIQNSTPDQIFARGVGRTFQLTRVFSRLTVLENMHVAVQREGVRSLFGRWSSSKEADRALELLKFVGLIDLKDLPAGNLSYGQKKLLEFAYILIAEPQVILLDEPAGGVNPTMINYLSDRIKELNRQGVTFFIVEHNMEFVMSLCDRVTVMDHGTTICAGTPKEVRDDPAVLEAYLGA